MPDIQNIAFSHVEIAELLVKQQGIHEGHWGIFMEFGMFGGNIPQPPDGATLAPGAVIVANKLGIQRFDSPNSLTIDASVVNPASKSGRRLTRPLDESGATGV